MSGAVMWCACGCGALVSPASFSVPEGANGTRVYYVDESHAPFAYVRFGELPEVGVDRAGFAKWVANMQKGGSGSARRASSVAGTDTA